MTAESDRLIAERPWCENGGFETGARKWDRVVCAVCGANVLTNRDGRARKHRVTERAAVLAATEGKEQ